MKNEIPDFLSNGGTLTIRVKNRPPIENRIWVFKGGGRFFKGTLNRQIKLLSKIDQAIKKINNNTYGYCEETGEPIGLKRLIARPIAALSIEAQEKHEKNEKIFADV